MRARAVKHQPWLSALHGHDGVELPPFQRLAVALFPGNGVTGCDRQAVPNVEVAAGVLRFLIPAILRGESLKIQGTIVEAMPVGVTNGEVQAVSRPLRQRSFAGCYSSSKQHSFGN